VSYLELKLCSGGRATCAVACEVYEMKTGEADELFEMRNVCSDVQTL
jgi:hypothetical protein